MSSYDSPVTHQGEPPVDHDTKTVMLVAHSKDVVEVEGHGEMTVVDRKDTYFGPDIWLDDGERNYRLSAPGFARGVELWRSITTGRGYIKGWERVEEVSAEIVEVGKPPQCECGELLESRMERSSFLVAGVCPH